MKDYIQSKLALIKKSDPLDDQYSTMHSIYQYLEDYGYTTAEARILIDEVIIAQIHTSLKKVKKHLTNEVSQNTVFDS